MTSLSVRWKTLLKHVHMLNIKVLLSVSGAKSVRHNNQSSCLFLLNLTPEAHITSPHDIEPLSVWACVH